VSARPSMWLIRTSRRRTGPFGVRGRDERKATTSSRDDGGSRRRYQGLRKSRSRWSTGR
jgi:hypothetical protein